MLGIRVLARPMIVAIALAFSLKASGQTVQPVLQRGYDANVSGANLSEVTLNSSNVMSSAFGLLFKLPVDEKVYAQPLYVPNVAISNQGTHNVLYVATMNDTLYAFDADVGGTPLWSVNLATLVNATPVPWADVLIPPSTLAGNLGILSTPVIDPSTNILYVVACTLENSTAVYRLHAIDITSGTEPYGPGVPITGSFGGVTFDAPYQTQRVSLALAGNQVVFGFAAMQEEEFDTYEGWVMAYNKQTLQQSGVFVTVASGNGGGGVWQSGRPPAVDSAGYVYVFSGNAKGGGYGYNGVNDYSESALKLDPSNGLALVDWFTAGNWSDLDIKDLDLSSSGPLLVPGTSLLAGGGKTGYLYVLNTADLGEFNADDTQIVQKENIAAGNKILGGPVYWGAQPPRPAPCSTTGVPATCSGRTVSTVARSRPLRARRERTARHIREVSSRCPPTAAYREAVCCGRPQRQSPLLEAIRQCRPRSMPSMPKTLRTNCGTRR
jgi:hypothetical protein